MPKLGKKKAAANGKYPVTHIVTPAHRLAEAKRGGEPAVALCGATVTNDGDPDAGICRPCVLKQFDTDDKTADERSSEQYKVGYERGTASGKSEGRREHANEIRAAADERARQERLEREKPRFEQQDGLLKFTFVDGGEATMRKDRIASVGIETVAGQHRVTVDGRVLVVDNDISLVRKHHTLVHDAVFGEDAKTSLEKG